jgi:hypothetical protein
VFITGIFGNNTASVNMSLYDANGTNDPTTSVLAVSPSMSNDIYIVKYNSSGAVSWFNRIKLSNTSFNNLSLYGYGKSLSVDSSNNLSIIGGFKSNIVVYNSSGVNNVGGTTYTLSKYNENSTIDTFLIKYYSNGYVSTFNKLGNENSSSKNIYGYGITNISTNTYMCGSSESNVLLYNGSGTINPTSSVLSVNNGNNTNNTYLVKYSADALNNNVTLGTTSSNGTVKIIVNNTASTPYNISSTSSENIYVNGSGSNTTTLGAKQSLSLLRVNPGWISL